MKKSLRRPFIPCRYVWLANFQADGTRFRKKLEEVRPESRASNDQLLMLEKWVFGQFETASGRLRTQVRCGHL